MITFLTFLFIVVVLWALRNLVLGTLSWLDRRKVEKQIRDERTQAYFAEARIKLMGLALHDKVSVDSATFKVFYGLNTAIMRRPDAYAEIGNLLARCIVESMDQEVSSPFIEESKAWSVEVKEVAAKTAEGVHFLIIQHSPFTRSLYRTRWLLAPLGWALEPLLKRLLKKLDAVQRRRNPTISQLRQSERVLYRLAAA
ncbi:MAG TPA: hypothetical protein VGB17_02910 [Pyrinomonadaceae bacterium]|jgi:hypothetical protein